MEQTRKEYPIASGSKFVVLSFVRGTNDPPLNDETVGLARQREALRPVTQEEFDHFRKFVGEISKPIAAFGNTMRGPSERGEFPGVPYLDTDGEIKVEENWTRGNTGDLWGDNWEFLFVAL